ncbi:MAG: outer rane lipoprotein chaperone LolA [Pseudomonadota bacterium]|jgi:outer membrane lipoprotein carrier protein
MMRLLVALGFTLLASLAEAVPLDTVGQLKLLLQRTSTMQGDFTQQRIGENGQTLSSSQGVFYLHRPGQFRWEYQSPQHQLIVAASGKVSIYDVDLEQVTVKNLGKAVGATPALLLTGDAPLDRDFIMEAQGHEDEMDWVRLVPRDEESSFRYVMIGLQQGQLSGMELSDQFGQLTRIYFSHMQQGMAIAPAMFQFSAPKGVDVLEDP